MKKLIFIMFLISISRSACCQFYAVHIPNDRISKIKIDGDTSDWNWVPAKYFITTKDMKDVLNSSKSNSTDWECKIMVGWNELTNCLFIMAKIVDDKKITDGSRFFINDCMQLAINAVNLIGGYRNINDKLNNKTILGHFTPPTKTLDFVIDHGPLWMQKKSNYINWEYKTKNIAGSSKYITIYEVSIALWDEWSKFKPDFSIRSNLYSGKKIRLEVVFDDVDIPNERKTEWATSDGKYWWAQTYDISQFILAPPVIEEISWDGIHRVLQP
jgi:hypothetical protein